MLLVDLLGFGYSDRPTNFGYTVNDHADTIRELIESLAVPQVDLVGHSMGGTIAIVVAAGNPSRIRRLVVSEPNLDSGGGFFSRPIAQQREEDYVANGHIEEVRKATAMGQSIWAGSLRVSDPVAVHRGSVSLVDGAVPSWRTQLAGLTIPRTVIFGANSLPDPDTEWLPPAGVRVDIVLEAGHSMIYENPSGFARAIRSAISEEVERRIMNARQP